jgi:pimeloyl-ACP methyl ester carboxylesterase
MNRTAMRAYSLSFTVALTIISKFCILRDRIYETAGFARRVDTSDPSASRHTIPSGSNLLDAIFVEPSAAPAQAAILICHGIGENVERWFLVQQLLAANGVASLVFDYSGYGRSNGSISAAQCDLDALSAFGFLQRLVSPLPIAILGFSLGTGPAAAISNKVAADRLVLCAAFTSFRDAVCTFGLPARLAFLAPPIWSAKKSLCECTLPILVVHGENDGLFPVKMARNLISCCPVGAELVLVPGLAHNQPFRKPHLDYWGLILSRLVPESAAHNSGLESKVQDSSRSGAHSSTGL